MRKRINNPSIFQAKLAFAPARNGFGLHAEHPLESAVFRTLLGMFLLLAFAYVYLVSASAFNVIARKEALAKTERLATAIGASEREYFEVSESITPESGADLGLGPVSNTAYVYRPGTVGQADAPHNEI